MPQANPLAQTAMAPSAPGAPTAPESQRARPLVPTFDFAPRPPPPAPPPPPPPNPAAVARSVCGRCGAWNEAGIRFCVTCGQGLSASARPPQVASVAAPPAAPALPATNGHAPAISPARVIAVTPPEPAAPEVRVCARCRGANDPGAQFCRFCGASLVAEARPAQAAPATDPIPPPVDAQAAALPPIPAHAPPLTSSAHARAPSWPDAQGAHDHVTDESAAAALLDEPPRMSETSQLHGGFSPAAHTPGLEVLPRARVVVISKDGGEGPSYEVGDTLDIGRSEGNVTIHEDRYLSPRHARIARRPEGRSSGSTSSPPQPRTRLVLKDLGSANGVFIRLRVRDAAREAREAAGTRDSRPGSMPGAHGGGNGGAQASHRPEAEVTSAPTASLAHPLRDQDLFLVGQQVLRFEVVNDADEGLGPASQHGTLLFGSPATPRYARLCQRTVEGVTRDVFYIRKAETVLGRESGDIVFTEDPFLSRRHASLRAERGSERDARRFFLTDLGSSNGTFVQIRGEIALENGDQFRVGQQLFRIDIG